MPHITTTYEIVTEESSMEGEAAEHGWLDEAGYDCEGDEDETDVDVAVRFLERKGAIHTSASHFHAGMWYSTDAEQDMHDGSYETHSFHLNGFTPDQEREIASRLSRITRCRV